MFIVMTKIDIFSGFLGAGKTTLIKKLIEEVYAGEKLVLIENEFGDVGVDGTFLQDAGIEVTEMSSGCICCSLVGDFGEALIKVLDEFEPDRILIEPSGVGKLSDVILAVRNVGTDRITLNSFTTVVDAKKAKMYMKNFGEFFNNQVEFANSIILSRTSDMSEDKINAVVELLREHNTDATIITTPWDELDGAKILEAMEHKNTLEAELHRLAEEVERRTEEEHEKLHHHHDHDDDDEDEHEHHHHHDHDHHGHHHHHADEVFDSWGKETIHKYSQEDIRGILEKLSGEDTYGQVLRAKGMVEGTDGTWIYFDMVPEEIDIRSGEPEYTGRLCVIGSQLKEEKLAELFGLN